MEDYNIPTQGQNGQPQMAGTPNPSKPAKGKGKKVFVILIVIIILVAAGAGAAWFLSERQSSSSATVSPTPTLVQIPTPTPTPIAREVERSEVTIQIMNGTGVPGEASFLQGELEDLGYETIEVGNADETDQTVTEVTFASDLPLEIIDEITELLNDLYTGVRVVNSQTTPVDISIITGPRVSTPSSTTPTPTTGAQGTPTLTPTLTPTPTS